MLAALDINHESEDPLVLLIFSLAVTAQRMHYHDISGQNGKIARSIVRLYR